MPVFTYLVPEWVDHTTELRLTNEHGQTIFLMQKRPHRLLARVFGESLRGGWPHNYKISDFRSNTLYMIDCRFPRINYEIFDYANSQSAKIEKHSVQLTEKAYSFCLSDRSYYFEKDFKGKGHLLEGEKEVAVVSMPSVLKKLKEDRIHIRADTPESASLAAVLFHTLYYYDA